MTDALPRTVGIVGLGLIGGSLARDLVAGGVRVLGFDRDAETARGAAERGVEALASASVADMAAAELVVLAVPVTAASVLLAELAPVLARHAVVTDLGSTKRSVVRAAERVGLGGRFVGSHPLAGDHRSGWGAAREGLFAGAPVYLCRTRETSDAALSRIRALWIALGARPEEMAADEHDRQLAWTSHLPQVAASALAAALSSHGWRPDQLGPGGRDATRLAASSPEIWSAIATDNADLIEAALAALDGRLSIFRELLREGDPAAIERFFALAHRWSQNTPPLP